MEARLVKFANKTEGQWHTRRYYPLTAENLINLFAGEIPAIRLPRFIGPRDCSQIVENLKTLGMGTYAHVNHPVGRFGLAQMEFHLTGSKEGYFQRVQEAQMNYDKAISGAVDPVALLLSTLRHTIDQEVGIATEPGHGQMFAGTFRNVMTAGYKHFDFAPIESEGWEIAKIENQVSWNLYLNQPVGGDLIVHNHRYELKDETLRVEGQYFYADELVAGSDAFQYTPVVGDVVLFNSRYIHEVKPVTGDRFSLSSFIGQISDESLILWS